MAYVAYDFEVFGKVWHATDRGATPREHAGVLNHRFRGRSKACFSELLQLKLRGISGLSAG